MQIQHLLLLFTIYSIIIPLTAVVLLYACPPVTETEAEDLFGVKPVKSPPVHGVSMLSQLLEKDDQDHNRYLEFAKWDASVSHYTCVPD